VGRTYRHIAWGALEAIIAHLNRVKNTSLGGSRHTK